MGRHQKKHSPTHTNPDHQTSFINFLHLPRSIASSIYVLDSPFPQPLSRSSLVFLLVWDPLLHTLYISSPNHHIRFATHAYTNAACFAVVPVLCYLFLIFLSQLLPWKSLCYLNATHPSDHSHLCLLKCHLIFFPYRPGHTPMQILFCTQLLHNLPLIISDVSLLVSSGTKCLNLFQAIRTLASTDASASPR